MEFAKKILQKLVLGSMRTPKKNVPVKLPAGCQLHQKEPWSQKWALAAQKHWPKHPKHPKQMVFLGLWSWKMCENMPWRLPQLTVAVLQGTAMGVAWLQGVLTWQGWIKLQLEKNLSFFI